MCNPYVPRRASLLSRKRFEKRGVGRPAQLPEPLLPESRDEGRECDDGPELLCLEAVGNSWRMIFRLIFLAFNHGVLWHRCDYWPELLTEIAASINARSGFRPSRVRPRVQKNCSALRAVRRSLADQRHYGPFEKRNLRPAYPCQSSSFGDTFFASSASSSAFSSCLIWRPDTGARSRRWSAESGSAGPIAGRPRPRS